MHILSWLAFFLVALAGYSSGAVLGCRWKARCQTVAVAPGLLDVVTVASLWSAGVLSRLQGMDSWHYLPFWLAAALAAGFFLAAAIPHEIGRDIGPSDSSGKTSGPRRMWRAWKDFALGMQGFQSRLLLTLFFFAVVTPWGGLARLAHRGSKSESGNSASFWTARHPVGTTLEQANKQY